MVGETSRDCRQGSSEGAGNLRCRSPEVGEEWLGSQGCSTPIWEAFKGHGQGSENQMSLLLQPDPTYSSPQMYLAASGVS